MLKLRKKMSYYLLNHILVYGNYTQTFDFFGTPKMRLFLGILDKVGPSRPDNAQSIDLISNLPNRRLKRSNITCKLVNANLSDN